ncbi:hypothetical protein DW713_11355 [Bacteroides stercoris]|nr:hypothetical protein DW713_11355 [Bacteroides stercoris]
MPIYLYQLFIQSLYVCPCRASFFRGKKAPNQQIISRITVSYADLFVRFQPQNYKNTNYPQKKSAKNCVSVL